MYAALAEWNTLEVSVQVDRSIVTRLLSRSGRILAGISSNMGITLLVEREKGVLRGRARTADDAKEANRVLKLKVGRGVEWAGGKGQPLLFDVEEYFVLLSQQLCCTMNTITAVLVRIMSTGTQARQARSLTWRVVYVLFFPENIASAGFVGVAFPFLFLFIACLLHSGKQETMYQRSLA